MKRKASSLWIKSPCTIGFPERNISFEKLERFSVHSIYYKEPFRPKQHKKSEILQPQKYLIDFRRQIEQCEQFRKKSSRIWRPISFQKKNHCFGTQSQKSLKITKNQKVIQRLTSKQSVEMDLIYDRNGNRSTFYTSIGQSILRYAFKKSKSLISFEKKPLTGSKVYVSGSTRIDLGRPQNFNPGPGSYFIDKMDTQQISSLFQKSLKTSTKKSRSTVQFNLSSTIQIQKQKSKGKKDEKVQKSRLLKISATKKSKVNFKCPYKKQTF